ncbi:hypothetical protein GMD78_13425 [Ornithinibacillus sp. L9]|uniref:Lipoprotein n=1 Tax=Ornithinibacillus caprae TaxID=2678566 RepID=A0A6N8FIV8_9BACI|nr:hypothetical protein [Ornithinibacillus caprae]MUK89363.1 hypothetical protein [Ornithinibacillus caprae]
MKRIGILMFLLAILLVGCFSEDSAKEESPSKPPETQNKNLTPPHFQPHTGVDSAAGILDKYCWENDEKNCSIEPNPPDEVLLDRQLSPMKVVPEEEISLSVSTSDIPQNNDIFNPTQIELIEHKTQEKTEVSLTDMTMTAPSEKGRYYYTAILRWDNSLQGEAAYAFEILVQ